jgi:AcrR family transcriptional regulator
LKGAAMRRAEKKQQTRLKVLKAAREMFAAQGYERATLRGIAQLAGVSVGSVFTTFESKEDVLLAIAVATMVVGSGEPLLGG